MFSVEKLPVMTDKNSKIEVSPPGNSTPIRKPPLNSVRYSKRIRGMDASGSTENSYEEGGSGHSRSEALNQNEKLTDTLQSQDSCDAGSCLKFSEGDNSLRNSSKL